MINFFIFLIHFVFHHILTTSAEPRFHKKNHKTHSPSAAPEKLLPPLLHHGIGSLQGSNSQPSHFISSPSLSFHILVFSPHRWRQVIVGASPRRKKRNLHRQCRSCDLFLNAFSSDPSLRSAAIADLCAAREHDPTCVSYSHCLLNHKDFLACQV